MEQDSANRSGMRFWLVCGLLALVAAGAIVGALVFTNRSGEAEIIGDEPLMGAATGDASDTGDASSAGNGDRLAGFGDISDEGRVVVARVNGMDITIYDVLFEMRRAEELLMWEYMMMFPDDEGIDYDRYFSEGMTFGRVVREKAATFAAELMIYENFARQMGLSLTGEEAGMIADHLDSMVEYYGSREELDEVLRGDGIGGVNHLIGIFTSQIILDNMLEILLTDPVAFAPFEQYLPEDVCDATERAVDIHARAVAGEDFTTLITLYGADPGMETFPEGYTFVIGDMVEEFEEAVLTLEIGEISQPVRTMFGYHIILRVEPDPENVMTGSRFFAGDGDDELFGAKHILIEVDRRSPDDKMFEAIFAGFEVMIEAAEVEFLPALDDVPVGFLDHVAEG